MLHARRFSLTQLLWRKWSERNVWFHAPECSVILEKDAKTVGGGISVPHTLCIVVRVQTRVSRAFASSPSMDVPGAAMLRHLCAKPTRMPLLGLHVRNMALHGSPDGQQYE